MVGEGPMGALAAVADGSAGCFGQSDVIREIGER